MTPSSPTSGAPRRRRTGVAGKPLRRGTWLHRNFLSRYPLGTKLLLLTCLALFPLGFLAEYFVMAQVTSLRSAAGERSGMSLYAPLDRFIWEVAEHSEADCRALLGGAGEGAAPGVLLERAASDLAAFGLIERARGNVGTHEGRTQLEALFAALKERESTTPAESLERHNQVLVAAIDVETRIGTEWGLLRDPDLLLDALLDVTLRDMPNLIAAVSGLRAHLLIESTPGRGDLKDRMQTTRLASVAIDRSTSALGRLGIALSSSSGSPQVRFQISNAIAHSNRSVLQWLGHVLSGLSETVEKPADLNTLLDQSNGMLRSLQSLHDKVSAAALLLIQQREEQERRNLLFAAIGTFVTVCLGGFMMQAVSSRTASAVRRLLMISDRIAAGQYDQLIDERGVDEISQLFAGFAEMQRRLSLQIGTERAQLVINNRIRAALDNVAGAVVVAAASGALVHVNKSAAALLREAEADIRTKVPEFNAEELHGQSLEPICEALIGEPLHLLELEQTVVREFTAGKRTFRIVANPVSAESGERFGAVMEWTDRTAEIAVENELQAMLRSVIEGSLDERIEIHGKTGFFEMMSRAVNELAENIAAVVAGVKAAAGEVYRGAQELSHGNTHLAQRTENQSQFLERTAQLMSTMTESARGNAESAAQADRLANVARLEAESGVVVVGNAVEAMQAINEASRRIATIVGVIDEIAFQTNLLALNAAVEAARAGEQGRSFAVVAGEVRTLAGRSASAAKEIKALIEDSIGKVAVGSDLVMKSGATLGQIVQSAKRVSDIVGEISAASREQTGGIEQVNLAMGEIEEITQQNAALVEQAAAASQSMAERAHELTQLMERYRVRESGEPAQLAA